MGGKMMVFLFCQQITLWTEDGQSGLSGQVVLQRAVEGLPTPSAVARALLLQLKGKIVMGGVLRCDFVTLTNAKPPMPRK